MKCAFCGKESQEDSLVCSECRAAVKAEPKPPRKSGSKVFLPIVVILLLLIPYGLGIARLLPSLPVKFSSTKVEAVVSQADPARHSTSFSSKKSKTGSRRETYTLTITQRIMVEFTLDGEVRRGDLGSIELMKHRSGVKFSQEEIDRYISSRSYEVGEPITVYANDIGEVHLAAEIDDLLRGGIFFTAIGNGFVVLLVWWKIERWRKRGARAAELS